MRLLPTALALFGALYPSAQRANQGDFLLCRSVETSAEVITTLVRHGLASHNDPNFLVGHYCDSVSASPRVFVHGYLPPAKSVLHNAMTHTADYTETGLHIRELEKHLLNSIRGSNYHCLCFREEEIGEAREGSPM